MPAKRVLIVGDGHLSPDSEVIVQLAASGVVIGGASEPKMLDAVRPEVRPAVVERIKSLRSERVVAAAEAKRDRRKARNRKLARR